MAAVEYLINIIDQTDWINHTAEEMLEVFKQAKEMEKQQIIDFTNNFIAECTYGDYDGIVQRNKTVEQYHNETFKNK